MKQGTLDVIGDVCISSPSGSRHKALAPTKVSSLVGCSRVSNAVRVNSRDKLKLLSSFTPQVMLFLFCDNARITYVKAKLAT